MAVDVSDPTELRGADVTGSDGDKIGKVEEVYLDNETERPEWAAVKTGMFGGNVSLVPLATATFSGGDLSVPFTKSRVKDAPNHDPGRELSPDDERELFDYYGIDYGGADGDAGTSDTTRESPVREGTAGVGTVREDEGSGDGDFTYRDGGTEQRLDTDRTDTDRTDTVTADSDTALVDATDESAPREPAAAGTSTASTGTASTGSSDSGDTMTRSEERLHVGTRSRESGRARLRKYVTTETQTETVPVSHEEVRVTREPISGTDAGIGNGELSEEEHEVTLHADEVVTEKETVPVERVRVGTETVTEDQTVTEEVSQENIDVDDGSGTAAGRRTGDADALDGDR